MVGFFQSQINGAFRKNGDFLEDTPIPGSFIMGKRQSKMESDMDDDWGYPYFRPLPNDDELGMVYGFRN